jgi:aminoglycoside phosphotransferase (APT) family kinase protein
VETLIRSICQKEGIPSHDVQALSGGQVNAVYRVDGQYVIRVGAREGAFQRLRHETALLRSLAGELPVPKVYAFGQLDDQVYQVQQYLPGQKLYTLWKHLDPDVQASLAAELAGYLRRLHQQSFPTFGYPYPDSPAYPSWASFLTDKFQHTLDEIRALGIRMAPGFIDLAEAYFADHQEALVEAVPTLVHSDLTLVNVLVSQGHISALLDFEFALHAPPDYELWALEAFCLYPNDWAEEENEFFCSADYAGFFPLLQKHYPELFATPRLRERVDLYQLVAALGSYLAWRKDNLNDIPPEAMAAKEFYMARITNFIFRNGVRVFL